MNEHKTTLDAYRTEIASLEARAREMREQAHPPNYEEKRLEADRLEEKARGLRRSLAEILHYTFGGADDDAGEKDEGQEEEREPEDDEDER